MIGISCKTFDTKACADGISGVMVTGFSLDIITNGGLKVKVWGAVAGGSFTNTLCFFSDFGGGTHGLVPKYVWVFHPCRVQPWVILLSPTVS